MAEEVKQPAEAENLAKLRAELEEAKLREQLYNIRLKEAQRELTNKPTREVEKAYSVEQDIKTYQNISSITVEQPSDQTRTIGDLKKEAMKELKRDRLDFIEETMYGVNLENRPYSQNARHFHETAFINIYENSNERFKNIVGERMELLKNCDYWSLLELDMLEGLTQRQFFKEVDKKGRYERSMAEIELQNLGRSIMMNNRKIV